MSRPTAWPKPRTSSVVNSCIPTSLGVRVGTHWMPWLCEAKKTLTVAVRAPLPPQRSTPSLALVLDLQDHLNLNAGAVGQRGQAHRRPGTGSGIAVELAQKVGGAV